MRRLLNLIRDNADRARPLEVHAQAGEATVYVYDAIDAYWGISAQDFVKAFAALDAQTIHLRINSPGGDVFEARAMATAIRESSARVVAHIDGVAASAATYVALAAAEVEIADGAMMMIHNAWGMVMGNAEDMRAFAATLEKVDGTIVADYARKTGQSEAQLRDWMAAETWFTAQEALDAGFVDRIAGAAESGAANRWNLAAYAHAPDALKTSPAPDPAELRTNMLRADLERRLGLYERAPGDRRAV